MTAPAEQEETVVRFAGFGAAVLAGAALATLAPAVALAEEPVDLAGAYVLDEAGVLRDPAAVESALDELFERSQTQLFVVLVDSFESPGDPYAWAEETAIANGLGRSDALLAIAVDDRLYSWSVDQEYPVDDETLDEIATERLEPSLREDDWDGAITAFADGISDEIEGTPFPWLPVLGVVGGVAVVGVGGTAIARSVRRRRTQAAEQADQQELDRRAGSLLVALDDALETNRQELGFAEAQFGTEVTADFREAIARAEAQAKEAFAIRQRLDDAQPESAEERRALTIQLIELCESADATLDAQAEAFEQLRRLESQAPQVLEQVAAQHAALPPRIKVAESTVAELRARFGTAGVAAIEGNPAQARKLLGFAGDAVTRARAALAASQPSGAAIAVRGAQQAVGQIVQLLDAVDRVAAELPALAGRLTEAIADTRADATEARTALESSPTAPTDALRAAIADADRALETASSAEPSAALTAIEAADAALATALAAFRDQQTQIARATEQLGRVSAEAQAAVGTARDYIATRRGAIGPGPRTRLAEAERELATCASLGTTDPVAALRSAQDAQRFAAAAMSEAQYEVSAFDRSPVWDEPDTGGAALGGILDGLFSGGGGWSGGGWSSGTGGWSGRGGWSSGRSGRGSSGGGFGGFSSSGRRSSGGSRRSSGGSRRSSGRRGGGGRF